MTGWMNGWMDGCMNECMNGQIDAEFMWLNALSSKKTTSDDMTRLNGFILRGKRKRFPPDNVVGRIEQNFLMCGRSSVITTYHRS